MARRVRSAFSGWLVLPALGLVLVAQAGVIWAVASLAFVIALVVPLGLVLGSWPPLAALVLAGGSRRAGGELRQFWRWLRTWSWLWESWFCWPWRCWTWLR